MRYEAYSWDEPKDAGVPSLSDFEDADGVEEAKNRRGRNTYDDLAREFVASGRDIVVRDFGTSGECSRFAGNMRNSARRVGGMAVHQRGSKCYLRRL